MYYLHLKIDESYVLRCSLVISKVAIIFCPLFNLEISDSVHS